MAGMSPQVLERHSSIQKHKTSEKTEQREAKDERGDRGAARQAGGDVGEPTTLADFTAGADGFHDIDVLAHAAWPVADFFRGPSSIVLSITVL